MKNFIVVAVLVMASRMAHADIIKYNESISCFIPWYHFGNPTVDDCVVKKGVIETGAKITRNGMLCIETVTELVSVAHSKAEYGFEIDSPNVNVTRHPIECPSDSDEKLVNPFEPGQRSIVNR